MRERLKYFMMTLRVQPSWFELFGADNVRAFQHAIVCRALGMS